MNSKPRRVLRQLITQYGVELHRDPKRTESLLRDLCGEHQREIFVLVQAQRFGIASELLKNQGWHASSVLWKRLSRQLQERRAFTEEAADWAVESWAHALDLIPQRRGQSWLSKKFAKADAWVSEHDALVMIIGGIIASGRFFRKIGVELGRIRKWRRVEQRQQTGVTERGTKADERRRRILVIGVLALVLTSAALLVPQVSARLLMPLSGGLPFWTQPKTDATHVDLATYYPLPQAAWLNADLFDVHAEPSIQSPVVSQLGPAGAQVNIDAYSTDGLWSHISAPVNGWISNDVLYVAAALLPVDNSGEGTAGLLVDDVASTIFVHVGLVNGQVDEPSVHLREGPGTNYAIRGSLDARQPVAIIAWTLDGSWLQIAKPEAGWVSADFVQVQWPTDVLIK